MNFLGISRADPSKIHELIHSELTKKEISELDLKAVGNLILDKAIMLNQAVTKELLEPISRWLDDRCLLEKFQNDNGDQIPNWVRYKQNQRQWTKQQKILATERLKLYWKEIRRKRNFRKELSKIISTPTQNRKTPDAQLHNPTNLQDNFLNPIISAFSPKERQRAETRQQFNRAFSQSISDRLPWKLLIVSELNQTRKFTELNAYYAEDRKKDTVSKLIHLLQMGTDGQILLTQERHLGEILIEPLETDQDDIVYIKDRHGLSYEFDWKDLGDNQKNKIIADIKANRIICKQNNEKLKSFH